jgi:hypothetical protein
LRDFVLNVSLATKVRLSKVDVAHSLGAEGRSVGLLRRSLLDEALVIVGKASCFAGFDHVRMPLDSSNLFVSATDDGVDDEIVIVRVAKTSHDPTGTEIQSHWFSMSWRSPSGPQNIFPLSGTKTSSVL